MLSRNGVDWRFLTVSINEEEKRGMCKFVDGKTSNLEFGVRMLDEANHSKTVRLFGAGT